MHPTASAAMAIRPSSRMARNCAYPRPRSPRRFPSGTRTSSRVSGWVSEACQPSLSYAGSAAGLGQAEGRQCLTRDEVGQPLFLLPGVAEGEDRVDPETDRRLERDSHRLVDPADLLDGHAQAREVAVLPGTAVLLRRGEA